MLESGVDINFQNNSRLTALHIAAFSSNIYMATLLLSQPGINVNIQDSKERTPLHIAALRGDMKLACMLVTRPGLNIKINLADAKGRTAFDLAEKYHHGQLADLFKNHGAEHGQKK